MEKQYGSILSTLSELNFSKIPQKTCDKLWKATGKTMIDQEENSSFLILQSVYKFQTETFWNTLLSKFEKINNSKNPQGSLWSYLISSGYSVKNFVLILHQLVKKPSPLAFTASRLYILLLIYSLESVKIAFHPLIFREIMNLLQLWKSSYISETDKDFSKEKQNKKKSKHSKAKKVEVVEEDEMNEEEILNLQDEEDKMDCEETSHSNINLLNTPIELVENLLSDIFNFLSQFSLAELSDTKLHTLEVLIELTRTYSTKKSFEIPQLAYSILNQLLEPNHGDSQQTCLTLLKGLLPNLLLKLGAVLTSNALPKYVLNIQKLAIEFVKAQIEEQNFLDNVLILLQHICTRVPPKADYRSHVSTCIYELFCALPPSHAARFLHFLQTLSKNEKSNTRLFVVELVSNILQETGKFEDKSQEEGEEILDEIQVGLALLEILQSRSSDKIASVRAKALGCLARVFQVASSNETLKQIVITFVKSGNTLFSRIRRRVLDEKSTVRKSALQLLELIGPYTSADQLEETDLKILQHRCWDSAVSIRKQAIGSLTEIFKNSPNHPTLPSVWIESIMPLILDPETTVQEKCTALIDEILITPIENYKKTKDSSAWNLLKFIDGENLKYFQRVIANLAKKNRFKKTICKSLEESLSNSQLQVESWMVLSEISSYCPSQIDWKLVIEFWNEINENLNDDLRTSGRVLKVIEAVTQYIDEEEATSLEEDFLKRLQTFTAPTSLIQSFIQTLVKLTQRSKGKSSKQIIENWTNELLGTCDLELANAILPRIHTDETSGSIQSVDSELMVRYLFTVGELAQVCPGVVPKRLITTLTSTLLTAEEDEKGCKSSKVLNPTIRASAFVALGKLCLGDETLAKKCIKAFVKELSTTHSAVVRNNIIVIMSDLCIKYTSWVDGYIPKLALCLRDPNELVRRQTLMLLTRLLQEEYIKWSSLLYYRFVVSLTDDSPQIRDYANFCFTSLIKSKNPLLIYNQFIECIFHLNDYKQHPTYNQFSQTEQERILFSLAGKDSRKKRLQIYLFLLSGFPDEQKFQTTAKICQEILGGIVDGVLPLRESTELLADALSILSSKEIKINTQANINIAEDDEEEALAAAKQKILSKIVKKSVLEAIVPIIVNLKKRLEETRSALLRNLMEYLIELLKDYKDEIEDILVADKQLAAEIQYDIKQFQQQQKQQQVQAEQTSPQFLSPQKRKILFSPKTTSPRAEMKNFSVPKVRTGLTPSRLSLSASTTPGQGLLSSPLQTSSSGPKLSPPFEGTLKSPVSNKENISPNSRRVSILPKPNIILFSPDKESTKPPKWHVELNPREVPLFNEEENEENNNLKRKQTEAELESPPKKKKVSSLQSRKKKK